VSPSFYPLIDVGLGHPAAQPGLADPEVARDLRDRLLPQPAKRDGSTAELRDLRCRHTDSSQATIVALHQVSGKPGALHRHVECLVDAGVAVVADDELSKRRPQLISQLHPVVVLSLGKVHVQDVGVQVPEVRYARTVDNVHIAYQVVGEGLIDLVYTPAFFSHLEVYWEEPIFVRFLSRLARFSRLIVFDKRGTGLSDRVGGGFVPTLEQRMDDVRAVMDAAGSARAALLGASEGGPMCALFAATYPERTAALVLFASFPRAIKDEDFPEGWLPADQVKAYETLIEQSWSDGNFHAFTAGMMEGLDGPDEARATRWFGRLCRMSVSPGSAVALNRMGNELDIRHILPTIQSPTLALCRAGDENLPATKYMAERIPGARFVELPGSAHIPAFGDQEPLLREIEEFLTGTTATPEPDRVLATVLFTDIVGSTEHAVRLGDARWAELIEHHNAAVRTELDRFRGREIDTAGDGFLATFDGPARAVRCAVTLARSLAESGISIRAGVHTGECELVNNKVRGIAVHTGARIASLAEPGEVLVSSTVKDLVAGSGLQFADRGLHQLKGVPSAWRLFAVITP
jgi:class 3 adenylate cyclase/dienelactone hydrolase